MTPAGVVSTFVSSGLAGPQGLAFDAAGNLYVANNGSNTVSEVTPAGAVSTVAGSGLDQPVGLAFDAAGDLYVANVGADTISEVALAAMPSVTNATTLEGVQTTTGLVITPGALNAALVTNFLVTGISGGTLYLNDGVTPVASGEFIAVAQGAAGLKFTPTAGSVADGSFTVQDSTAADAAGLLGVTAAATITVRTPPRSLGVYYNGYWYLDTTGTGQWTGSVTTLSFGAPWLFTPIVGDWDGSGKTEIGYYLNGTWCLLLSDGMAETFTFGFTSTPGNTVIPVVGDWNGDGKTEVGVYCNGAWFRDVNGTHTWDATNQAALAYLGWNDGGTGSVVPVPGYWAGDGKTEMGVYCQGVWFLDSTGAGKWDGSYSYWGWSGSLVPVVGNWGQVGDESRFGVYTQGVWFRDMDGTHQWDATNQAAVAYFGWAGAQPVVGDWYHYIALFGAQRDSLPTAVTLPRAAAALSPVGAAIQASLTTATSPGGNVAQEQGNPLALAPNTSNSGPTGTSLGGDGAAGQDHEYMVPAMAPSQTMGPAAIDPQAVDRIDLAAAIKTALGPCVRLSI